MQKEITDEVLFELAIKHDQEAMDSLVYRYKKSLFGLLIVKVKGDRYQAEELFQEAFFRALRSSNTFNRKLPFKFWFKTISMNLVRDWIKKNRIRKETSFDFNATDSPLNPEIFDRNISLFKSKEESSESVLIKKDQKSQIHKAMAELTTLQREVVVLHFFKDMTLEETASAIRVPVGTVKSRLNVALTRLRQSLDLEQF